MIKVAFVGWRGLVGSVLLSRMKEEKDFERACITFFSTSSPGKPSPKCEFVGDHPLMDANSLEDLLSFDMVMSCQGSDYTQSMHTKLRKAGWKGFWLDAASLLRMEKTSSLVLDPLNKSSIKEDLKNGFKDFVGSNCTVSLMLLALDGLFKENLVEWVHTSSYQAISGAGSKAIEDLFEDVETMGKALFEENLCSSKTVINKINSAHKSLEALSKRSGSKRLGANVFPWIDSAYKEGQTKEEAKGQAEANKILNPKKPLPIDGTCVRVPVLRSHSQNLTVKLKKHLDPKQVETLLKEANPWVKVISNTQKETLSKLLPSEASCTLDILVGRVRKLSLPDHHYEVFTVGDQLLWGAAEPLRRAFHLLVDFYEGKS